MTGSIQKQGRIERALRDEIDNGAYDAGLLERWDRATRPGALLVFDPPVIAPAEDLQADDQADDDAPDARPALSPRFGLLLFLFVAAVIAHHAPWSAAL